jgi:hypothetical protein
VVVVVSVPKAASKSSSSDFSAAMDVFAAVSTILPLLASCSSFARFFGSGMMVGFLLSDDGKTD